MLSGKARAELRRSAFRAKIIDRAIHVVTRARHAFPDAAPDKYGIRLVPDVSYGDRNVREHHLDAYIPKGTPPFPVVLYVHGGAFSMLSKETHRGLAMEFARRGYLVFNIDYRLGAANPFPRPLEDAALALSWVRAQAASFDGDPTRIVLAGESAGGNLALALALLTTTRRPEPFARTTFDGGPPPAAVAVSYPFADLTEFTKLVEDPRLPRWVKAMMFDACSGYLGEGAFDLANMPMLASPLLFLENGTPFERPFPPTFVAAGTRDPLLPQTRRLKAALDQRGVDCDLHIAAGEIHGYDVLTWRSASRAKWEDLEGFLRTHLAERKEGDHG